MQSLGKIFQHVVDAVKYRLGYTQPDTSDLPDVVYPDDLFLVSYPKSGNTWMRFILANLLRPSADEVVNFVTANAYIPSVGVHLAEIQAAKRPRILKSHVSRYVADYPKVLYLVRDPRDVYVSYYFYLKKRLPEGLSLSEFIRSDAHKMCAWHEHVEAWIDRPNLLLVRYEDMLADISGIMRRVVPFWGARQFSDEWIAAAIEASSFQSMRELEQQFGHQVLDARGTSWEKSFMRRGVQGDWKEHLTPDDLRFIHATDGAMMKRLGYDRTLEQAG